MDEEIIDEIFNDEANNTISEVEVPLVYSRTIVCKTTSVNNAKQLLHEMAVVLNAGPFHNVQVYNTTKDNVFVIAIQSMGRIHDAIIKRIQKALYDLFNKELRVRGFIEIEVFRDLEIFVKERRVIAAERIYKPKAVSHNITLEEDFMDILTRQYDSSFEKTIVDFPDIIFNQNVTN